MARHLNVFKRVEQWAIFAKEWLVFDAYKQCPYQAAPIIAAHLEGKTKPFYQSRNDDCGNYVVVINSRFIALHADDWRSFLFRHNTGYAKGKLKQTAWMAHYKNSKYIMRKAVYSRLQPGSFKATLLDRLLVFEDSNLPQDIWENISGQIPQIIPVPRRTCDISNEERQSFPILFDWPKHEIFRR
ncbi:MAG: 54S ribosomal protein L13 [Marteilia pararefringens]